MKSILIVVMAFVLMAPFYPAFASWHWSSPWEVCGTEVIKKGEKCDLRLEDKKETPASQSVNTAIEESDDSKKACKNGFQPIIKKTTNSLNCVKESSFEKLIQRGWGLSP